MRIVSTVPSQTELLSYLGLDDHIVGITKFCVHPDHIYRSVKRIGGTKELDLSAIDDLRPDLIIANKEENVKEQIEELQEKYEVHVTDVHDLDSALEMIRDVGAFVKRKREANELVTEIKKRFDRIRNKASYRVLYLIWQEPYMSVGADTFIHDMLNYCGLDSVTSHLERYPEVRAGTLEPELILLSSEPFPFKEKHVQAIAEAWPQAHIKLVDGEYFSWYGSRLLDSPRYFEALIDSLASHQ